MKPTRLAEDTIDKADLHSLIQWLETSPWLSKGPLTVRFEDEWARWLGTQYAVFCNSGSSANLLMYAAAQAYLDDPAPRCIVPAISWATTVAPAIQLGYHPILCDADPDTWGMNLSHLSELVEHYRPDVVTIVHTVGCPNRMEPILELKEQYGFLLLEDCCSSYGSTYKGRMVGTFGDMSSASLYFAHFASTIEGGMVNTNDPRLRDLLLMLRSHGWARDLAPEREAELALFHRPLPFNRIFTFYHPGFNVRSTDLQAHIGLSQLTKLDSMVQTRMRNHRYYQVRFRDLLPEFVVQQNADAEICSISFAALAPDTQAREQIGQALRTFGIETRPLGGGSMGRQPFWTHRYGVLSLPVADQLHECAFMVPNHHNLSLDDIDHVVEAIGLSGQDMTGRTAK